MDSKVEIVEAKEPTPKRESVRRVSIKHPQTDESPVTYYPNRKKKTNGTTCITKDN